MGRFNFIILLVLFASFSYSFGGDGQVDNSIRNPGDSIYRNCTSLSVGGFTINNACVNIKQAETCGMDVVLSVEGQDIISDHMDKELPQVCGDYSFLGVSCDVCVGATLDPYDQSQRCVTITPSCPGYSTPSFEAGCFAESLLQNVVSCSSSGCPANCNGNGQCVNGACVCDENHFGDDCGFEDNIFEHCQAVQSDYYTGDVCVRVFYAQCSIGVQVALQNNGFDTVIYNSSYEIANFKNQFQSGQIVAIGPCSAGIAWTDLFLNDTFASGCGNLTIGCPGNQLLDLYLGCFQDRTILPTCFATCPSDCSGNGVCYHGICQCNSPWQGSDCSDNDKCEDGCNGNGLCQEQGCLCSEGWAGVACSIEKSNTNISSGGSKSPNIAIIIPVVLILVGIAAVIGVVIYVRRSRNNRPQFTQLDIITAEDDDDDLPMN